MLLTIRAAAMRATDELRRAITAVGRAAGRRPPAGGLVPGLLALGATALAAWCIVSSHPRVSQTFDEPHHLATGLEWWQFGTYTLWTETPPVGRASVAFLPYLAGARLAAPPPRTGAADPWALGNAVLARASDPLATLRVARLGVLPWFLLGALATWTLARRRGGRVSGGLAVLFFVTLPVVIAHAGLATTDVPMLGTALMALLAFDRWVESPSTSRSLALGAGLGLAVATKFSAFLLVPAAMIPRLAGHDGGALPRRAEHVRSVPAVALTAALVVWGVYGFSLGSLGRFPNMSLNLSEPIPRMLAHAPVPAPAFWHGLLFFVGHVASGEPAYLLGQTSPTGFWFYYPVAIAVKTPLSFFGFLAVGIVGAVLGGHRGRRAAAGFFLSALLVLVAAMTSRVNLGVRHVLLVLPLLALAASLAAEGLLVRLSGWRGGVVRAAVACLAGWQALVMFTARPDYLAYFNGLAGTDPGYVLSDSDLDWGQDLGALVEYFETRNVDALHLAYFGTAPVCGIGLPPLRALSPARPVTGWVAISDSYYRGRTLRGLRTDPCDDRALASAPASPSSGFDWLRAHEPVAWAGRSIRIYFIPASVGPTKAARRRG